MKVLVADLNGTLLGGDMADRVRLQAALSSHPEVTVVFATGRGLDSVRQVLADPLVPKPRWIIADAGASVVDGVDLAPVRWLQRSLRTGWPGATRVRDALRRFPALAYQTGVAQNGRCSFYLHPDHVTKDITDAVEALGCGWVYSASRYFDVLPRAASKGGALLALARWQQWPVSSILVAGDSLNDLSLFQVGAGGVIVANAETGLRAAVPVSDSVLRPDQPGAAGVLSALEELGWLECDYPLVVGYHRPPLRWTPGGWQEPSSPNGILPTLRAVFAADLQALWVTGVVLGPSTPSVVPDSDSGGLPLSFVPFSPAEWAGYFHHICKEALWPVLMSQPHRLRFDPSAWDHYTTVNDRFAEHIAGRAAPGGTVWLHDYNLWLVPGRLRSLRPDLRLGLFHHTPFPPADIFNALPTAPEIRESLECLDWAGFHTEAFAEHFQQLLAGTARPPRVGVHPLGIDRVAIEALARARPLTPPAERLILSVERLDYVKAPVEKVNTIAALLARDPSWRGQLRFRLICPPPERGINAYNATRDELERRVADVNHAWGAASWQPIDYLPQRLSFTEVIDNYLAADVFWVTSLQDGMNLTAKEFVATQMAAKRSGVLVLSQYTGAASQLGAAALLTDPNSATDLVDTLQQALTLSAQQRRARLEHLSQLIGDDHPIDWARQIVTAINSSPRA